MSDQRKTVTIKDIARRARVSIGTVDRVVHDRGRVAEETSLKVKKIIDEMGYKPNIFASRLSRSKVFYFAVLMPKRNQDSKYWESSIAGIEKAETELSHYHIKVKYFFYDRYSAGHFHQVGEKIVNSNVDGVLIAPILDNPVKAFVAKLPAHIPYVFFNTRIPELSPLAFIGQDSFQSGSVCGKLMKLLVHEPGTIAIIITGKNDLHIQKRAEGFESVFKDLPGSTVKRYEIFSFKDKMKSMEMVSDIFLENGDLRGIFVANVSTHYLAEYLEAKMSKEKIFLIGYDLIEKNVDYLKKDIIDFLISQKPELQGYEGIYTLYRSIVLKKECSDNIAMPIDIITRENVDCYNNP